MTTTSGRTLSLLFLFLLPGLLRAEPNAVEQLILATCKVAHDSSTGTGFIVEHQEKRYLVTAHHVLDQLRSDRCTLVSRTRNEETGAYQRKDITVRIRDHFGPTWRKHPDHDLVIVELPGKLALFPLPFACLATREDIAGFHTGDPLRAAVFPEREEANGAGIPVVRSSILASFPVGGPEVHPTLLFDMPGHGGDSGGPVMHATVEKDGKPLVVGIILGKRQAIETVRESRNVERRITHDLHLASGIHAVFARDLILKAAEK